MPRRRGARLPIAPPASLALASSILIALAALAPNGAAAKRSEQAAATEAATAPAAAVTPAAEASAAIAAAERAAMRQARREQHAAASAEPGAPAPSAAASPAGVDARQAAHAVRRAERSATREARKHGASTAASPAGASAQTAAGVKASKSHAEREREHDRAQEQRRREREANGGRLRESRKQREAREVREVREAAEEEGREAEVALGDAGSGRQALAAGGVSSLAGGSATAQAPSAAAVASTRAGQAARARRQARARRAAAAAPASIATVLGLGVASTAAGAGEGAAGAPSHTPAGRHARTAHKSESPLVRTVTQIVGVIPTALWLLIGLLALAAAAFAISSRVIARRARRLERQRRELLEDVGLLQAALLPELPERLGPVATSAAYRPASGPGAGGDFYDVFALPDGLLAVIVGDVSGHGREALPHTTLLRYTLRAYMEAGLSPREALRAAAPALERQLGGSFATVVLASYDPRARLLTYSCAGHPHPILTGLDPDEAIIAASAPPIGAGNATGSRQTVVSVPGASTACFYTDGVIEARADGRLYGSRRLARALGAVRGEHEAAHAGPPVAAELLDRVAAETDRRPDDMAACLLELAGEEDEPRIVEEELVLDAREAAGKRARRFLEAAGVGEAELAASLERARILAAEHGTALVKIDLGGARPRVSILQENVAPLRARALARTQEVAL